MTKLQEIALRYCQLKSEMDSYKKQVDADNKSLKELMSGESIDTCEVDNYVVKYSVSVSESFDEDKLLSKLRNIFSDGKGMDELGIIVYKPTVDMEALEDAIYRGVVNAAELSDCKVVKETPRITISKRKDKNNE